MTVHTVYIFHLSTFFIQVRKDTRVATKTLEIEITKGIPPLMVLACADDKLCFTAPNGVVFVNPTVRLALVSDCTFEDGSDCTPTLTYKWSVQKGDAETEVDVSAYNGGDDTLEQMAISTAFFDSLGAEDKFQVTLETTNGNDVKGKRRF